MQATNNNSIKIFCLETTLEGWRITSKSTIAVIEELFAARYIFLTRKFNQDSLEVRIKYI